MDCTYYFFTLLRAEIAGIPVSDASSCLLQKPQLTVLMDHAGPTTVAHVVKVESAGLIKTGTKAKDVICI